MSELTDYIDKWAPRRPNMAVMRDIKEKVAALEANHELSVRRDIKRITTLSDENHTLLCENEKLQEVIGLLSQGTYCKECGCRVKCQAENLTDFPMDGTCMNNRLEWAEAEVAKEVPERVATPPTYKHTCACGEVFGSKVERPWGPDKACSACYARFKAWLKKERG